MYIYLNSLYAPKYVCVVDRDICSMHIGTFTYMVRVHMHPYLAIDMFIHCRCMYSTFATI